MSINSVPFFLLQPKMEESSFFKYSIRLPLDGHSGLRALSMLLKSLTELPASNSTQRLTKGENGKSVVYLRERLLTGSLV